MKAAVLEKVGSLKVKEISDPRPGNGDLLIKVIAAGICGTDTKLYKGEYAANVPVILGHEFSGEVVEVGHKTKSIKVGDRVVIDPNVPCETCYWCRAGKYTLCENLVAYGVTRNGGFAGLALVKEKAVYKIPENLSYEIACFAEPVSCAIHCLDRAEIKLGDKVAVMGGGSTGQILLQLAKLSPASEVIMITRSQWKLDLAKSFGADKTVKAERENVLNAINDMTADRGVDVVIEAVGSSNTVEQAITLAKKTGRIVIFGLSPEKARSTFSPFAVLSKEITIVGSWINPFTFPIAIDLLSSKVLNVGALISMRVNLDDIAKSFTAMSERPKGFMKAIVRM